MFNMDAIIVINRKIPLILILIYVKSTNKQDHFYIKNANKTDSVLLVLEVHAREPIL